MCFSVFTHKKNVLSVRRNIDPEKFDERPKSGIGAEYLCAHAKINAFLQLS